MLSSYPIKSESLKYCLFCLVNDSTSDIDADVPVSVSFVIVCPTNLRGFPEIISAIATSLLINLDEDGLTRKSSKFTTVGVTP